jgi:hypothetical protein
MASFDDLKSTIRRNKFLGMWAAEKLGLSGEDAEAYGTDLAIGTIEFERSDVFVKIRKDFDIAGVAQSDEQILEAMNRFMLEAGSNQGSGDGFSDAAAAMIVRKLTSR